MLSKHHLLILSAVCATRQISQQRGFFLTYCIKYILRCTNRCYLCRFNYAAFVIKNVTRTYLTRAMSGDYTQCYVFICYEMQHLMWLKIRETIEAFINADISGERFPSFIRSHYNT